MKRWGKWGVVVLGIAGAAAVAGRAVVSQQPGSVPDKASQLMTGLFAKAQPFVEEALGTKLDFTPQFRSETNNQYLDHDLQAHIRWHFPQLQGQTLARTQLVAGQIVASALPAHYVEGAKVIAGSYGKLPEIAFRDPELAPVNSEAFLQLALVQEVVRWHLDRQYQLDKLRDGCHDAEEADALLAVVDGRVQAVTHRVACKLGSEALFPLLAKCYLRVPDSAPDASQRLVSQTTLHSRFRACTQGELFWTQLAEAGLPDAERQVFTRLPRQMTVLARPAQFARAVATHQPDLAAVLQPLESALAAAQWVPLQQTWTPAMLTQAAGLLGASQERADKVGRSWFEGRTLVWSHRAQADRQVALSVVRLDDEQGGRSYFGFAIDLQRKQDAQAPGTCGPTIRVVDSKTLAVNMVGFDEAVQTDKLIAFGDAAPIPVSQVLARAGTLVIECNWHGQAADPVLAERLVQAVREAAK